MGEKAKKRAMAIPPLDNWSSKISSPDISLAHTTLSGSSNINNNNNVPHLPRILIDRKCLEVGFNVEETRASVTNLLPEIPYKATVDPVIHHYKNQFYGRSHFNFCGEEPGGEGWVVLSVLKPSGEGDDEWTKVLVRTKKEDIRLFLQYTSRKDILREISKHIPSLKGIQWLEVKDPAFHDALTKFEADMLMSFTRYKFGVLLCLDGQTDENEMFSNKDSTPEFEEFLSIISAKIELKGWDKFKGGLDNKNNATGIYSYHTDFQGLEVMFHVSTLLPYQAEDPQRVERKRHIGNDIVTVIFKSGKEPFSPSTLTTKFTLSLDRRDETGRPYYQVAIANKPDIQPYPPFVSYVPVFEGGTSFREFLLAKLINGERAALRSAEFRNKLIRTRRSVLDDLAKSAMNKQ